MTKFPDTENPLISIITVVYNGADHLEETIRSVIEQDYNHIEYFVIDGGSTDGSLAIIRKYEDRIARWISEPDSGIYEAMNKGIDAANGDWLFFLGSDDKLYDRKTIGDIKDNLRAGLSLVYGNIRYTDNRVIKSRFNFFTLLHNTVHHQSAFYNAALFAGWRYDATLKLVADYELNLLVYLTGRKRTYIDKVISVCNPAGQSRKALAEAFKETNAVRKKVFGPVANFVLSLLYFIKFNVHSG